MTFVDHKGCNCFICTLLWSWVRLSLEQKWVPGISIVKPIRCTIFRVYWISLCMFQMVFLSIIRSPRLYIELQVYVIQVRWLLASGHEMELMLYVQPWTSDDGRKDRPKHVEWYSLNSKNCAASWFYYRNISRFTVPWTSNEYQWYLVWGRGGWWWCGKVACA